MENKFFKKIMFFVLPVVVATTGSSPQAASSNKRTSIEKMTSKDSAEKVATRTEVFDRASGSLKIHSLGIGVGQTFLSGGFADLGEDKITWDLFYNYTASYSFDFMANAHYSSHSLRGQKATLGGLALGIKGKVYQFDSFSPFLTGGLGFYIPKVSRGVGSASVSSERKTTFGYHFGGGGELDLNPKVRVGMLAQFHNPFDVKQDNQADVEGSYFKLLLTVFYNL